VALKCLSTVEKMSKDQCTSNVANADLNKHWANTLLTMSTNNQNNMVDLCKMHFSKRGRRDDSDTDDDDDNVQPPARKKSKRN
jgi:hypothetical protein